MPVMGRPKRGAIDVLKAKAWFEETKRHAGDLSAYALNKKFLGKGAEDFRYFHYYQRGTKSPSLGMLLAVEKAINGTRNVHLIGPTQDGVHTPLWQALNGTIEEVWEVLEWFDPTFARSRLFGFTQQHRIDYLLSLMAPSKTAPVLEAGPKIKDLRAEDMGALSVPVSRWTRKQKTMFETAIWIYRPPVDRKSAMVDVSLENTVTKSWALGKFTFDVRLLAATVSLWRLSHFLGEGWREMDYLMRGLILAPGIKFQRDASEKIIGQTPTMSMPSAVAQVLAPWNIEPEFVALIDAIWQRSAQKYGAVIHTLSVNELTKNA